MTAEGERNLRGDSRATGTLRSSHEGTARPGLRRGPRGGLVQHHPASSPGLPGA